MPSVSLFILILKGGTVQVWANLGKSGQAWANLGKPGQAWASLGKPGQIHGNPKQDLGPGRDLTVT